MNDTANASGAGSTPSGGRPPLERPPLGRPPLRRPREGRVLAGVAAGIANHLGIDVAIVRILIVLATFMTGGFGVPVYIVAIFVIPAADDQEEREARAASASRAGNGAGSQPDAGFWIGVSLLLVGVLWLFGGALRPIGLLPTARPGLIWPLVLIGFGLALWRASDRRTAPEPARPWQPQDVPPAGAAASTQNPPETPGGARTLPATSPPGASTVTAPMSAARPAGTGPTHDPEDTVDTQQTSRLEEASPGGHEPARPAPPGASTAAAGPSSSGAQGVAPPPPPGTEQPTDGGNGWTPPDPPKGSLLTRLTLGAALVTVGVLWLLRMADAPIGVARIVAGALLVVGIGLLVGAWFGHGRWLILVGGLLLPIVILAELLRPFGFAELPPNGARAGFGEIVVAPVELSELEARYQLTAGSISLDLRDLEIDEPTELFVGVGMGEVLIRLPADVSADVTARVGAGEHRVDDRVSSGLGVPTRRQQIETGNGSELLTLDVAVGMGQIEIDVIDVDASAAGRPGDGGGFDDAPSSGLEPARHDQWGLELQSTRRFAHAN